MDLTYVESQQCHLKYVGRGKVQFSYRIVGMGYRYPGLICHGTVLLTVPYLVACVLDLAIHSKHGASTRHMAAAREDQCSRESYIALGNIRGVCMRLQNP